MNEIVWASRSFHNDAPHIALVQELIDITAPRTTLTFNPENDNMGFFCPVGVRHWSRSFEWPWAIKQAGLRPRDVILEAGGGDTEFQFLLSRRASRVVNFDHDQGVLDASEMYARQLGISNILCRRGDLVDLYYPDAYFDKVFCVSVVEHIENVEDCIDELWRVLKPGGRLILTMDVVEHLDKSRYFVDMARAQQIVSRWGLSVPDFPEDGMRQSVDDDTNVMLVLCVSVNKSG